jgi:Spy/CpxP family protein refolding chaperone
MNRVHPKWLALSLGVAVLLAVAAGPADATRRGGVERLQSELGLSQGQVTAIQQYRDSQKDTRRQLFRSLREARRTLRELVLSGAADDAIQAKTAEVQTLQAQTVDLQVEGLRQLSQVLTPEQREKLKTLRPRHGHR